MLQSSRQEKRRKFRIGGTWQRKRIMRSPLFVFLFGQSYGLSWNTKRGKRICTFPLQVSPILKLPTFHSTTALQLCKLLWWRSGCSVLCPFYWVILSFLSLFSSAGFEIRSSLRCPGYWTYQAMKKQSTSFQDDSATHPRESASFCR